MSRNTQKASKFLSYILRHKPESIGLNLDAEGWASIDEILEKSNSDLSRNLIIEVIATSDKKRFSLSPDGSHIRANQGHLIKVNLGLQPIEPPEILYHGTSIRFLKSIREQGLKPGARQQVHLSSDRKLQSKLANVTGNPLF